MGNITEKGYRVDYIAVHFYTNDSEEPTLQSLDDFLSYMKTTYPGYKLWLTEFANTTGTQQDNINYFNGAYDLFTNKYNGLIERYSWFTTWAGDYFNRDLYLQYQDGTLTDLGKLYASKPKDPSAL